jgi:hypothetical protein
LRLDGQHAQAWHSLKCQRQAGADQTTADDDDIES